MSFHKKKFLKKEKNVRFFTNIFLIFTLDIKITYHILEQCYTALLSIMQSLMYNNTQQQQEEEEEA